MPDWLAHVLFAYIVCNVLGIRFKIFNKENTAIVMIGALIPDIVKVGLGFDFFGLDVWNFIAPLHTPVGSLFSAALISLLFYESVLVFSLLIVGFTTHFILDLLMGHVSGGMLLLFPFSWDEYQLGSMQCDEYRIALIMVFLALLISIIQSKRYTFHK